MSFTEVWTELEDAAHAGAGTVVRRVHPEAEHDILLGIEHPGRHRVVRLRLLGPVGEEYTRLKPSRGLDIRVLASESDGSDVEVKLTDDRYRDVFTEVMTDVVSTVVASTETSALDVFCRRLRRWQRFLEIADVQGLTSERQAGLYAELLLLGGVIADAVGLNGAIAAWTGPVGTPQDFQLNRAAVEVKASRGGEPQHIQVSSERQLDPTGVDRLFLAHFAFDTRRAGIGRTLPQLVAQIRDGCPEDSAARAAFEDRLSSTGYNDAHEDLYDTRYTTRDIRYYEADGDFPRLVEADLPEGVGRLTYRIAVAACEPFRCTETQLSSAIAEASNT
jgi:hypothetical protein